MARIYISKTAGFFLLFVLFVLTGTVLFIFYQSYGVKKLVNPLESLSPLGKAIKSNSSVQQVAGSKTSTESKNKLTIIFFYEGYETQQQALVDVEVMKKAFSLVEPFKSLPNAVTYQIFTTEDKKCKVDLETRYLVCDKSLIESFRKLGTNNFKVVLMSRDEFVSVAERARGKNSWLSVSTNPPNLTPEKRKEWLGLTVTRLLGYSLGLSYEGGKETVEPSIPPEILMKTLSESKRPNCAPDKVTAQKWWGGYEKVFPSIGYFKGCGGHKDYYFPEEGTLMSLNPKKETYGRVSEDYLRGVLTCFYGKGDSIVFGAGKEATYSASLKSCDAFTLLYPNFWVE